MVLVLCQNINLFNNGNWQPFEKNVPKVEFCRWGKLGNFHHFLLLETRPIPIVWPCSKRPVKMHDLERLYFGIQTTKPRNLGVSSISFIWFLAAPCVTTGLVTGLLSKVPGLRKIPLAESRCISIWKGFFGRGRQSVFGNHSASRSPEQTIYMLVVNGLWQWDFFPSSFYPAKFLWHRGKEF